LKVDWLILKDTGILKHGDYCQSEHFFLPYREEIKSLFRVREFKNHSRVAYWERLIQETKEESVCIHVRRGDFVTLPTRSVDMAFFPNAMQKMYKLVQSQNSHNQPSPLAFFFFSDDIHYVEEYFQNITNSDELAIPPESTLHWVSSPPYTSGPNSDLLEDFHLMSQCNHNIIIASSYAWWAAYLNRNDRKIVIAGHYNPELFKDDPYAQFQFRHFYYPIQWYLMEPTFTN
jgi:hypothetical protein